VIRCCFIKELYLAGDKYFKGIKMKEDKNRVCPVELAGSLDNRFRRWIQNPYKILSPYVKEGMKVLDVGCGPRFFLN
jgi:hypothetical protein